MRRIRDIASTAKIEEEKMKNEIFTHQKEKIELQKKNRILVNEVADQKKDKKVVGYSI